MSRFDSMGCEVVVEGASAGDLRRVRALFEERDAIFSRFRPDSELNRVNAADRAGLVSPLFARMVEAALWARETTGGLVDPTLGAQLEAAGYDRDFDSLVPSDEPFAGAARGGVALFGRVLVLRRGTKLDLNGVVKAAAVTTPRASSPGAASSPRAGISPRAARWTWRSPAAAPCGSSRAASRPAGVPSAAGCAEARSSTT